MEFIKLPILVVALPWAVAALVSIGTMILLILKFVGSKRSLWFLGLEVFVAVPLLTSVLAALAARLVERMTERALVGVFVGGGALIGMTTGLAILGAISGSSISWVRFLSSGQKHLEERILCKWMTIVGASAGLLCGLVLGIGNLLPAMVAGMIGGAMN